MSCDLSVSVGQYSDKGRKAQNQDFHGVMIPKQDQLATKGVVAAIADGISSSTVSHIASESSVRSLLEDYMCTSETWSVKKSVMRVLSANNAWLNSQTFKSEYRFDKNKGYVCTLSALIVKSNTAYIFHIGDSRIYRFRNAQAELLTTDHRTWVSEEQSYLCRAMGMKPQFDADYHSLSVNNADIFVLATDGIYEFVDTTVMYDLIRQHPNSLDIAASKIAEHALTQGSDDNLSVQIIRIDNLPNQNVNERVEHLGSLPFPPVLDARQEFDGFNIIRSLHATSRSHVYLAQNISENTHTPLVIKAPSIALKEDPAHLERFLTEEWIAKRINSPHVLKPSELNRSRNYVYTTFEFIEGQTLTQWIVDNPKPSLQSVRNIVEQIAKGLMAFHRLEMLHQDLRPDNIMIDKLGVVKIIDFGSTKVAGITEMNQEISHQHILGTVQYTAPEYFLGEAGEPRSDLFSLGVITYQMLTGQLPYGTNIPKTRTRSAQRKLRYQSALHDEKEIPAWIDHTLQKALHIDPLKRYQELSEFLYELNHPSKAFLNKTKPPLIERNPLAFWQGLSVCLMLIILLLLAA
ncbi:MAG: bifunctional protein-serine/threonine kinase/phosphatase [Glaciecola sp.]